MVSTRSLSLVTLVVQNSSLALLLVYSQSSSDKKYYSTTAVVMSELVKIAVSLYLHLKHDFDGKVPLKAKLGQIFKNDSWKMAIPAILYTLQNNLQYYSASKLDATTFQIASQLKILTTAICSVLILKTVLNPTRWMCLLCLAIGVAVVQIETPSTKASTVVIHSPAARFQGLLASLLGSFTSGLAGVYFELVLKSSQGSIWLRNVQIATFSIIPALIGMIYVDGSKILTTGPFYGYNIWTILTILDQALGGLLVAVVVKYADNILKGFATSLSIIISSIVSVYLFGMRMSLFFTFGATLVVAAAYVYGVTPTKPTK